MEIRFYGSVTVSGSADRLGTQVASLVSTEVQALVSKPRGKVIMKSVCIISTFVTLVTFWVRIGLRNGFHSGHLQRERRLRLPCEFKVSLA